MCVCVCVCVNKKNATRFRIFLFSNKLQILAKLKQNKHDKQKTKTCDWRGCGTTVGHRADICGTSPELFAIF